MFGSYKLIAVALFAILLTILGTLEFTLGQRLSDKHQADLNEADNWALAYYQSVGIKEEVPAKGDAYRIVYLSNSHAYTGGHVSKHLQKLLSHACHRRIEILDLSSPGIFAPEFLERAVTSLDFDPDLLILSPAYISFSDHMPLARQAHSARSFFNPAVFSRLPVSFWLNNYDIGLYLNTYFESNINVYRYRNEVRDIWESKLISGMNDISPHPFIRFLDQDENQSWRFPKGFDNNLFQWELYSHGRSGHIQDFGSILEIFKKNGILVFLDNLPIHWEKEPRPRNVSDVKMYRETIRALGRDAIKFVDHQESFPVKFASYDALHPTWHGARLFALDFVLRSWDETLAPICGTDIEEVLASFLKTAKEETASYRHTVDIKNVIVKTGGFRRYDVTEPTNAVDLLSRLTSSQIGSKRELDMLYQFAVRRRYWMESKFFPGNNLEPRAKAIWVKAFNREILSNKEEISRFTSQVEEIQTNRLAKFPVPDIAGLKPMFEGKAKLAKEFIVEVYLLPNLKKLRVIRMASNNQVISVAIWNRNQSGYERFDIFLDGSFASIRPFVENMVETDVPPIPELYSKQPFVAFGI